MACHAAFADGCPSSRNEDSSGAWASTRGVSQAGGAAREVARQPRQNRTKHPNIRGVTLCFVSREGGPAHRCPSMSSTPVAHPSAPCPKTTPSLSWIGQPNPCPSGRSWLALAFSGPVWLRTRCPSCRLLGHHRIYDWSSEATLVLWSTIPTG